ncbi:MAG TPA: hypothetical protein VKE40_07150 [Gemmataceae bacterium]|nr:hypothetical protein [Gemmataceae bacterium]
MQPRDRRPPYAPAATIRADEELPQVNVFRLVAIEGVPDRLFRVLEQDRLILAAEPPGHAGLELGDGHRVAVPLVADEPAVHRGEGRGVGGGGGAVLQGRVRD